MSLLKKRIDGKNKEKHKAEDKYLCCFSYQKLQPMIKYSQSVEDERKNT